MFSYNFLPKVTAPTIDEKELSSKTTSLASFVISEPPSPIAIPISALFIAGASFIPSPVTATTSPLLFKVFTSLSFENGVLLATTFTESIFFSSSSFEKFSSSFAVYIPFLPSEMSNSLAISVAVSTLSPVSIIILMPAFLHCFIASFAPFLIGSMIETNPSNEILPSYTLAKASTRFPFLSSFFIASVTDFLSSYERVTNDIIFSGAPLTYVFSFPP